MFPFSDFCMDALSQSVSFLYAVCSRRFVLEQAMRSFAFRAKLLWGIFQQSLSESVFLQPVLLECSSCKKSADSVGMLTLACQSQCLIPSILLVDHGQFFFLLIWSLIHFFNFIHSAYSSWLLTHSVCLSICLSVCLYVSVCCTLWSRSRSTYVSCGFPPL